MTKTIATAAATAILALCHAGQARAQTFAVSSISSTDLGNVAAAPSGQTVFRTDPATGMVVKVSGSGARISSATARSLVTVTCGNQSACNSKDALITIATTGGLTNRASALMNFTISVSGATATIVSAPGSGSPISFTIGPVGKNLSKSFWLGFDLPINGDNTGGTTGLSTSQFAVTVSHSDGSGASASLGTAQATVFRSIAIAKIADLAFGSIVLPSTGAGTVSLNEATGTVTVTGTGTAALTSPAPTAAAFSVTGEGGQSVSLTIPGTIALTRAANSLTVTTTPNISGAQVLSGALGLAGSLAVRVGGSFPVDSTIATGTYSGAFTVTVQYN
jgi:hypothetical protein